MANAFHQKRQVAGLSPRISLSKKFPTMTSPRPHKKSGSFVHGYYFFKKCVQNETLFTDYRAFLISNLYN